jgi:ribosomal protein L7/L12
VSLKYQPLPKNTSIVDAIVDLGIKMGAELAAARAQIAELTAKVDALTKELSVKPPDNTVLNQHEKDLVHKGWLIDAIKAYRSRVQMATGTTPGLKESKDLVEAYKYAWQTNLPPFNPLHPPPLLDEHKKLIQAGLKIDAIKAYREYTKTVCSTHAGLKEAKDMCDAYVSYLAEQ